MDIDEIKNLMAAMKEAGINKVCYEEKGFKISLEHGAPAQVVQTAAPAPLPASPAPTQAAAPSEPEKEGIYVNSPMVGTFYSAPSPDDKAFVSVGDQVSPDTVVCIVEAMKVMNEVKAGVSGKLSKVLISDGEAVEFGTKLFEIEV